MVLEVHPADVDEREQPNEAPAAYVARIARHKAISVARKSEHWVLAADTTVTLDGAILGKAENAGEASKMLRWLSGKTHQVLTAYVVIGEHDKRTVIRENVVSTDVTMIDLDGATLADYVASGEWKGKAGADPLDRVGAGFAAVQGIGAALVKEIKGSITNVIGLPLVEVLTTLREVGGPRPKLASGQPA
jgi:septum formation protein